MTATRTTPKTRREKKSAARTAVTEAMRHLRVVTADADKINNIYYTILGVIYAQGLSPNVNLDCQDVKLALRWLQRDEQTKCVHMSHRDSWTGERVHRVVWLGT